jgi:hypothetical protein
MAEEGRRTAGSCLILYFLTSKKESIMNSVKKILSLTVVGCGILATLPAQADTAYHRVYNTTIAASDPFSILDKHQNNVLTIKDYNNGALSVPFTNVDANGDQFITRSEFYAQYRAKVPQNATDINLIMPAAGGDDEQYRDDQCVPQF